MDVARRPVSLSSEPFPIVKDRYVFAGATVCFWWGLGFQEDVSHHLVQVLVEKTSIQLLISLDDLLWIHEEVASDEHHNFIVGLASFGGKTGKTAGDSGINVNRE